MYDPLQPAGPRPIRFLLPPNFAAAAARDAIPLKIATAFVEDVPEVLRDACKGRGPWLIQAKRAELRAVVRLLQGRAVFAWSSTPVDNIPWSGGELEGVSEHLDETPRPAAPPAPDTGTPAPRTTGNLSGREPIKFAPRTPNPVVRREISVPRDSDQPAAKRAAFPSMPRLKPPTPTSAPREAVGETRLVVDGSEHYVAISLPSKENPAYDAVLEAVKSAGFSLEPANRRWWLRDRHRTLAFLANYWERLEKHWGADFTEGFRQRTAQLRRAEIATEIRETPTEFEVSLTLQAGGATPDVIAAHLAQGRGYVEHAGTVYLIPRDSLRKLQEAQSALAGRPGAPLLHRSTHRIARARAAEVQEPLEALSANFRPPDAWRARSDALRDLTALAPAPLPDALDVRLRSYQRLGTAWLYHLAKHELGGVLADEMGLGKTAQALSLLVALARRPDRGPSLVVCPASLVENWRREAARFAPDLRVFAHHGTARLETAAQFAGFHLVATSYGTLARDQELFAEVDFACLIADEAQHVKNRRTQTAQALRGVRAEARFCLTGTPVENSLDDLRSLFEIVLPGAIAPIPNDARGDDRRWHEARLRRQSAPYILRRTKVQVAPELPAKIEQIVWCTPTDKQRAFYEEMQRTTEREIDALAYAGESESRVRLAVLTQLLRLRQVCCDPRLVTKDGATGGRFSADDSAKLAALRELLDEALDDGHRVLVFSQFTSLLGLVREELAAAEIAHCYLDGSLSPAQRQAEVDRFQTNADVPVFLISLKAGGTGLNLTGADTVVHLDPWWNPAVEAQATDRAHRIGQTRTVTSYKLIVTGSVEEKVLQLQDSKRRLLADVFEESDAVNAQLELADLRALVK